MKNIIPSLRRSLFLQVLILATLLPGLSLFPVPLQANPSGASVVHGNVAFNGLGTSQLNITQGSQNAIINWQTFSINAGETTTFIQPNQSSVALNRVTGVDPSAIYGTLAANGGVIVINPNGIVVGPGGRVDVAGMLTMSTLDIDDQDFLDGGPMRFKGDTSAGIRNYGAISSANGDVVLLGNFLQNSGQVSSATGTVAFGAGGDIVVNETSNGGKISVLAGGVGGDTGIENTAAGEINGAAAELKAHGNVYALAIKNDGLVRANGYNFSGGKLTLSGGSRSTVMNTGGLYARNSNGSGGRVSVSGGNVFLAGGTIDASGAPGMAGGEVSVNGSSVDVGNGATVNVSGSTAGAVTIDGGSSVSMDASFAAVSDTAVGGSVDVTADSVLIGSNAQVDASGVAGGGSVRIGGGFKGADADIRNAETVVVEEGSLIIADSAEGDAGQVVIWADQDTTFGGEISAQAYGQVGNGGSVEVSGKDQLRFRGGVSTLSANGQAGLLLLDPTDVLIGDDGDAAATIGVNTLVGLLGAGNVAIDTGLPGNDNGDIVIDYNPTLSDFNYDSDFDLSLFANGDIVINDDVQNAGEGNINMFAGWTGTAPLGVTTDIDFARLSSGEFGDWGQNGGDVVINGAAVNAVSVGSAGGETNAFGDRVIVSGGNGNDMPGQLGYLKIGDLASGDIKGDINIQAKGDVRISSIFGDISGGGRVDSHVIVGHGGADNSGGGQTTVENRSGDNDVSGNISVISETGDVFIHGGNDRSWAQIGHGGYGVVGDKDGTITVTGRNLDMQGGLFLNGTLDSTQRSGAHIGHGGLDSHGGSGNGKGYNGAITVIMSGGITGSVGDANVNPATVNFPNLTNGSTFDDIVRENTGGNTHSNIHIGHGGQRSGAVTQNGTVKNGFNNQAVSRDMEGHTGEIIVEANGGSITMFAGSRANGFVQFGHGGRESNGNHSADITVTAANNITLDRKVHNSAVASDDNSFVMIGNGGNRSGGAFTGDITVDAGGNFKMVGGHNTSFAQVGHGGFMDSGGGDNLNARNGYATLSGHINITTGGSFEAYAGSFDSFGYAMVGHGGNDRIAYGIDALNEQDQGHHGNIMLNAGGDVIFQAKPEDGSGVGEVSGNNNFAQLGHGGYRSSGDHYGAITIETPGSVTFEAGEAGWEAYRGQVNGTDDYNSVGGFETVVGIETTIANQGGEGNYARAGHGGFQSHFARTFSGGTRRLNAGMAEANIKGFGTIVDAANGIENSDITITAGGNLTLTSAQELSEIAQSRISNLDTRNGFFDDTTGDYIGPRIQGMADLTGQVDINQPDLVADPTADPVIREISRRGRYNYTQVGHGGVGNNNNTLRNGADAVHTGDIKIDVDGSVTLRAGGVAQDLQFDRDGTRDNNGNISDDGIEYNHSLIGHGGAFVRNSFDGEIEVKAGGNVDVRAGEGFRDFGKIGHGGYESGVLANTIGSTTMDGSILVESGGSIQLFGGNGQAGGFEAIDGTITNVNDRNQFQFAQIGHGAGNRGQTVTGDITTLAAVDVNLFGGSTYGDAYTQIGHGGLNNADINVDADIEVIAGFTVNLISTAGVVQGHVDNNAAVTNVDQTITSAKNYAKIGHGDTDRFGDSSNAQVVTRENSIGEWNGDIEVSAGFDINSQGGIIGHADPNDNDDFTRTTTGDTFVAVGRLDPFNSTGRLTLSPDAAGNPSTITSAGLGFGGTGGEGLRLYLPGPAENFISSGTILNDASIFGAYTRIPLPDGTRVDEQIATEFTLSFNAEGIPEGDFTPEGDFVPSTFGFYSIFYADEAPLVVDPVDDIIGGGGGIVDSGPFNFLPFFFVDQFDSFARGELFYSYDGYDGQLYSFGAEDAVEEEGDTGTGGWFFEEALDGALGSRRSRNSAADAELSNAEANEELERRKLEASRQVGRGGQSFYVFDPSTNRYSSYRVFGIPQTGFSVAE